MFSNEEHDLLAYVAQCERIARDRCNGNQIEAAELAANYIKDKRSFDGYDAKKLIERVQYCRSNGAKLDLNDPGLRKGGQSHNGWTKPPASGYR